MSCSQATELNEAKLQEVEELKAKVQNNIEHLDLIKELLYQLFFSWLSWRKEEETGTEVGKKEKAITR